MKFKEIKLDEEIGPLETMDIQKSVIAGRLAGFDLQHQFASEQYYQFFLSLLQLVRGRFRGVSRRIFLPDEGSSTPSSFSLAFFSSLAIALAYLRSNLMMHFRLSRRSLFLKPSADKKDSGQSPYFCVADRNSQYFLEPLWDSTTLLLSLCSPFSLSSPSIDPTREFICLEVFLGLMLASFFLTSVWLAVNYSTALRTLLLSSLTALMTHSTILMLSSFLLLRRVVADCLAYLQMKPYCLLMISPSIYSFLQKLPSFMKSLLLYLRECSCVQPAHSRMGQAHC